jgi:outer membrane lipoprotein SlyB
MRPEVQRLLSLFVLAAALAGCSGDYSPNTYDTSAVQHASKVERGVVIGVRDVKVSAKGTAGAVTGAAAGGVAGAQTPGGGVAASLGAIGGSLVGGLVGSSVEQASADSIAYEYIVRKTNGDLVSVTQKDNHRLAIGQKVLVIAGPQARIVPDYTVDLTPPKPSPPPPALSAANPFDRLHDPEVAEPGAMEH